MHTTLPERPEVFEERVRLFPSGCRKLLSGEAIVGYGISHPWILFSIPPLDTFLRRLPGAPDCLYIHDLAILPAAREKGAAAIYMNSIKAMAREMEIPALALVSVYGTDRLWSRFGFTVMQGSSLDEKLQSYGAGAKYMVSRDNQ